MKRPLKVKVIWAVLLIVLAIDIGCIAFNYTNYVSVNRDYINSLAETVANTCQLVIDGDRVADYLQTRQRDTQYYEVWNKLIDYRNTNPDIVELSVKSFQEDGAHYVFDTNLTEQGAFLGDIGTLDSKQNKIREQLIGFEEVKSMEYHDRTDIYVPIKSSYNIPVAYVVVGISSVSAKEAQLSYLMELTCIVSVLTLGFGALLILFMQKSVVVPINKLSYAAANYSNSMGNGTKQSPLSQIHIRTGDELERLCDSMKKMETDILKSSVDLAVATWNSNHDFMTKLYNKGYYLEMLETLKNEPQIGIIYFDIDNLKKINDNYGHDKGDEVIIKAANFIHKYATPQTICCRTGGDEFVMLIRESTQQQLDQLVLKMRKDKQSFLAEEITEFCCRLAIGGTVRKNKEELAEMIKRADNEMYLNKHVTR